MSNKEGKLEKVIIITLSIITSIIVSLLTLFLIK